MTPTAKLRLIERIAFDNGQALVNGFTTAKTIRVLQQWHTYDIEYPTKSGEWRDVTLEKEECCGNPFKCMGNCNG